MKTATIIFVALTVFSGLFLESSSAPNLLQDIVAGGGSQNSLGEGGGGLLKKILETGFEPLGDLVLGVQKLLADVKPEIKETVEGILKELIPLLIKLSDAIKNSDLGLIQKILKLVDEALEKFNTDLAQLSEKYGDDAEIKYLLDKTTKLVADIVTKVVKLVKAFLKELFDKIANGLLPELKEFVAGLLKALDKAIAEASGDKVKELTKIKEIVYKLLENTVEINKAFLEAITTGNLDKLLSLVAGCKSNIAELKQICEHTDLPDDVKNILAKFSELVGVILSKLEGIIEIIKNLLVTVLGKTLKEFKALIGGVLGELPAGTTELGKPLEKLSDLLCKLLIALENGNIVDVQKLEVLICKVIKKIKEIVAKLLETLDDEAKKKLEKVLQVIEKVVKKLLEVLKPIIKELFIGVKEIISKLIKDLAGILKKIEEALAEAKGELKELLKRLLKDLKEKLLDLIRTVAALLVNVTEESLNKFNGLLKEIEDILLEMSGILESKSGEAIGKELKGFILVFVDTVNEVLVNMEVIVKVLKV